MSSSLDNNVVEGLQNDEADESMIIFGRDITKIPCFRNSFLTGIYGGVGCGVLSFLATSRPIQSTHVSVVSFSVITLAFWFNCRRKWAWDHFRSKQAEDSFPEEIESIAKRKKSPAEQLLQSSPSSSQTSQ